MKIKFIHIKGQVLFKRDIITKMGWGHLKIFFSRTIGPILTRLGTNYPWVKGVCMWSKEGNSPFPRGNNSQRVKIH
jgi:hypothetical protein